MLYRHWWMARRLDDTFQQREVFLVGEHLPGRVFGLFEGKDLEKIAGSITWSSQINRRTGREANLPRILPATCLFHTTCHHSCELQGSPCDSFFAPRPHESPSTLEADPFTMVLAPTCLWVHTWSSNEKPGRRTKSYFPSR